MPTLDFALKVVSPAFVAGAMEKEEETEFTDRHGNRIIATHRLIAVDGDGLRIPSLRGVLRFWYRAMHGYLSDLKVAEAKIFGDTERGQGLRLIPNGIENWRADKVTSSDYSLGYLGYGPMANITGGSSSYHRNGRREAISPGTVFHFRAVGADQQIDAVKKCLLLLHLFGGVGSRSRRAWGSLAVNGDFIPHIGKTESIGEWYKNCLLSVWPENQHPFRTNQPTDLPSFSAFSRHSRICISQQSWPYSEKNYTKPMRQFFDAFRKIRHYQNAGSIGEADHNGEKSDFDNLTFSYIPRRIAFGMPFTASSRNNWGVKYKAFKDGKEVERRASPLFLKVFLDLDNRKLYALSLLLKSQYLGVDDSDVKFGAAKYVSPNVWAPIAPKLSFPNIPTEIEEFWSAIEKQFMQNDQWQEITPAIVVAE